MYWIWLSRLIIKFLKPNNKTEAIPLSIEDERKVAIEVTVGNLCSTDYLNKDDYSDMAIVKVTLDPANEDDLESWKDKLEDLDNKKTFLYLLVDAHNNNADKEVIYHGQNPGADGKPDESTMKNHWLDMEGKWFELKNESCCTADITTAQLEQIFTNATNEKIENLKEAFNEAFDKFSINTCLRKAHFFAQIREEVGSSINTFSESLNYSVDRLQDVFSYFSRNSNEAELYGRSSEHAADQEAIANRAYANRLGNGDIASGDGWNYRGKGYWTVSKNCRLS